MNAMRYASRIEAELMSKALAERSTRKTEAAAAFAAMQESIQLKRKQQYASFSLKQKAALALKLAERKNAAAAA